MINYIWFALILIAVAFAGYKDVTGVPVRSGPDPTVLVAADSTPLVLEFGPAEEVSIPLPGLPLKFESPPANVGLSISGTDLPVRIDAAFTDAIGRRWEGRFPLRRMVTPEKHAASAETARFTRLELASLRCADDPLETQLRHPLTLDRIILETDGGTAEEPFRVTVNAAMLEYSTTTKVRPAIESKTWMGVLTGSSANWAGEAITLAFNLIGIMMLWLGLMKIAEAAGLVQVIARGVKPVMVLLFPGIPADGPAMGAIVMNIAANMLGLGNAATPLGLKAMQELQELNPNKEHASNAMCMLLALNTSGVQIIPATIIGFRVAQGSTDMLFWPLMIVSTVISTIVAVVVCKLLQDLPAFRVPLAASAQPSIGKGEQK